MRYLTSHTQVGDPTFNGDTTLTTITGTATITMREGPAHGVQTTIEISQDKVISITPDPAPLENHWKYANLRISGLARNDGTDDEEEEEDETLIHDRYDEHDRYDWYNAVAPVSTRE